MDRGNIPGFYYDEDKKKYFKIQAGHLLPQGHTAMYATANVKREGREAKRQKMERRRSQERRQQTVQRARILTHPVTGGLGLGREHGTARPSEVLEYSDRAIVSQWRPQRLDVPRPFAGFARCDDGEVILYDAHYIPESKYLLIADAALPSVRFIAHFTPWAWDPPLEKYEPMTGASMLGVHSQPLFSISTYVYNGVRRVLTCMMDSTHTNITLDKIPDPGGSDDVKSLIGVIHRMEGHLGAPAIHPDTGIAAVPGSELMYIIDAEANVLSKLPTREDGEDGEAGNGPAADWLNPNTVAFGCNDSSARGLTLWDVRIPDATNTRFPMKQRITGVRRPDSTEHRLLVSTNHAINIYDTRMGSEPYMAIPHVHQGPWLHFATDGRRTVAAVNRDNVVQTYSTRTGHHLGALGTAPPQNRPDQVNCSLQHLKWYDDDRDGPCLMACQGTTVVRWRYGGVLCDDG